MSSTSIAPGTLCAALCITPNTVAQFHWVLYLWMLGNNEGHKFHATNNMGATHWHYEDGTWSAPFSNTCVTLTPLGKMSGWDDAKPAEAVETLRGILSPIPMTVPDIDRPLFSLFTCRVWFRAALRLLNAHRLLAVPDIDALERHLTQRATATQFKRLPSGRATRSIGSALSSTGSGTSGSSLSRGPVIMPPPQQTSGFFLWGPN
ncbi:hypothetical protein C8Q78DRAFT_232748 [Trametes maxima]|nr:hypothetical protein C8Q78DRAFT_232748 [Trametes maxima]